MRREAKLLWIGMLSAASFLSLGGLAMAAETEGAGAPETETAETEMDFAAMFNVDIPLDTSKHEHTYRICPDSYEATDTEGGYRHYRCTVCGDDYSYKTDPMVYTVNPKTGEALTTKDKINPYLPNYEFMPDNELHVFWSNEDDEWRVYAVGSHDMKLEGWCGPDVNCWSAPVYDLADWRYEGVLRTLPESVQHMDGPAGNFAACDFAYDLTTDQVVLFVNNQEKRKLWTNGHNVPDAYFDTPLSADGIPGVDSDTGFDPAIYIDPDGNILVTFDNSEGGVKHTRISKINSDRTAVEWYTDIRMGEGELNLDGFEPNHFEASTIDKVDVDGHSYWVVQYSMRTDWTDEDGNPDYQKFVDGEGWSWWPLVYVYSDPDLSMDELKDFSDWHWGGVIGDNAGFFRKDLATGEVTEHDTPVYSGGNNHGGLAYINGNWYVSDHRHTSYNAGRQGYIREVNVHTDDNGALKIDTPEYTSSIYDSIDAYHTWPAYIACHLWPTVFSETHEQTLYIDTPLRGAPDNYWNMIYDDPDYAKHRSCVIGITNGSEVGFKYLDFGEEDSKVSLSLLVAKEDGYADGTVNVYLDAPSADEGGTLIGSLDVNADKLKDSGVAATGSDGTEWSSVKGGMDQAVSGVHGVFFVFESPESGNICKLDEFTFAKEG